MCHLLDIRGSVYLKLHMRMFFSSSYYSENFDKRIYINFFYKIHFRFILCLLNRNNATVKNSKIAKDKTGERVEPPVTAPLSMSAP